MQYEDFYHSINTSYEQYDATNLNSALQSTSSNYYNSNEFTQEYYYRLQLVTVYDSNGGWRQIANTSIRIKVDVDLNIHWTVFTTDGTPSLSFLASDYFVSKTRLLLHFTPKRFDFESIYQCDCLFPNMEEINNCFNAYNHFHGLAQAYPRSHDQLLNNSHLSHTLSINEPDQIPPLIHQVEPHQPLAVSLNSSISATNFSDKNIKFRRKTATIPGSSTQTETNGPVTTSENVASCQPAKTELSTDNLVSRVKPFSKGSIDSVDIEFQSSNTVNSNDSPAMSRLAKLVCDSSKNSNHRNINTSLKNSLQFCEVLNKTDSSILSNENLEVKSNKSQSVLKKKNSKNKGQTVQRKKEAHKVSEVSDCIGDSNQPKNVNYEAQHTNSNEQSSKKRKLSETISNTSKSNNRNEFSEGGVFNSLIDAFTNPTNNNSDTSYPTPVNSNNKKAAKSSEVTASADIKISHLAIKGSSVRLADEMKMQARLDRFKPQNTLTAKNYNSTSSQNIGFLGASTKLQINSISKFDKSIQSQSVSSGFSPNDLVNQSSINHNQIDVPKNSQSDLTTYSSNTAIFPFNKKISTSLMLSTESQIKSIPISDSVKTSRDINDLLVATTDKPLTITKPIFEHSTNLKSSKENKVKLKLASLINESSVTSQSSETSPECTLSVSKNDSKKTISTGNSTNEKKFSNDTEFSTLKKKIQIPSINNLSVCAVTKDAGFTLKLSIKKPSVSEKIVPLASTNTIECVQRSLELPVTDSSLGVFSLFFLLIFSFINNDFKI